ncbi:acyl-CoA dehydrogenase family protein [Streptomyces lunaelactis]|uniref:acyl-CoA dehydrogenase family protein n=1 Tax=Streptomyces lunaelactis TaxID=1535768 RepID=UPI00158524C2|nr:acyl-CoA dehydrogenase family protein [Streptomyces lunaelactis]NUK01877.1 acyl-CoA dehydrogenase family protein [Streptomyces lunaelactis]NUK08166.1 acyl-CoA dehydrogenase family protein [Streptomyces lunaelactis]NUK15480.1 acyl-CoA dehydrogenase family protein [Streptomyces lunaelactis]NUK24259.1 acyl-CoA dehydrogenase family protein [Streptomyces lunaelactis]NUK50736.1 acyl-CoA dehydrogenase family protein [Streptomyces lunaelactis]
MDFEFGPADDAFRTDARVWLGQHMTRDPAGSAGLRAWERELGRAGWIGLGWDTGAYGNRRATLTQQVVWAEEYARAGAPGRLGHIGENLLAPTLIAYGSQAQQDRFLPAVARGEELWCQGYSEPGAGSDLAAVRTAAVRHGDVHRISGQKIWTSLAHEADWCFVLARTEAGSRRHHGLSFLLVPMDQPGRIDVRPIRQMSGTAEFNEVFFDGALASAGHVVGGEGNGWRVAMGLLALERGVSTLVQQIGFAEELARVVRLAAESGAVDDPVLKDRLVRQWAELRTMRFNALRTLAGPGGDPGAPSVAKLLWGGWHQRLGELAMAVRGAGAAAGPYDWSAERPYELDALQRLFLFTRADTIYGGSDEIQRNIIAERVLGLPREPR